MNWLWWILIAACVVLGNIWWFRAVRRLSSDHSDSAARIYLWSKFRAPRENFTAEGWRYRNLALGAVAGVFALVLFAGLFEKSYHARADETRADETLKQAGAEASDRDPTLAGRSGCPTGLHRSQAGDAEVSICLPAGFAAEGRYVWSRPGSRNDAPDVDWIGLILVPESEWKSGDTWPLRLAAKTSCRQYCAEVAGLRVYEDSIGGASAHIETGIMTKGIEGPSLVASFSPAAGTRAVLIAGAAQRATLDTFRVAIRTMRFDELRR
jgi:hypothetical protein